MDFGIATANGDREMHSKIRQTAIRVHSWLVWCGLGPCIIDKA